MSFAFSSCSSRYAHFSGLLLRAWLFSFLSDLAVVLAVSLIGWFFGKMVHTLSALFTMLLTAAVVDLDSFYLGPTHTLIETAEDGLKRAA
jgi:phosphoglycerol transferase MdoB-like AlkP superfamily enzyme